MNNCDADLVYAQNEASGAKRQIEVAEKTVADSHRLLRAAQSMGSAADIAATAAHRHAVSAAQAFSQLQDAPLHLKRLYSVTGSHKGSLFRGYQPRDPKRIRHCDASRSPWACEQAFNVESDSWEDLVIQMSKNSGAPAVYDLQGKTLKSVSDWPKIPVSGVTLCNGTFQLNSLQSLTVDRTDVIFHRLTVLGGLDGIVIISGGGLSMTECNVRDVQQGIRLKGNGMLVASGLSISSHGSVAVEQTHSSRLDISDAVIFGGGFCMSGQSSMSGKRLTFTGPFDFVLHMKGHATASLNNCNLTTTPGAAMTLRDSAALIMTSCMNQSKISKDATASVIQSD